MPVRAGALRLLVRAVLLPVPAARRRAAAVKVILAETIREAELEALERGIPPRGRDTVLVATGKHGTAGRGLMLARGDVIECSSAKRGRYYAEIMRSLEPAFVL